jgi:hypothetical protein
MAPRKRNSRAKALSDEEPTTRKEEELNVASVVENFHKIFSIEYTHRVA